MSQWIRHPHRRKIVFAFLFTFILSVLLGFTVTGIIQNARNARDRERAASMAEIMAGRLSHVIDKDLSITHILKALLIEGDGAITDFYQLMPDIIGNAPIRYATLAPGGIISEIYPPEGNEGALGYDLLEDPEKVLETSLATDTKELTLSGPYNLRLGGIGLVGRLPVYLNDSQGNPYFWGFTSVTVSIPDGFNEAGLHQLESQGYAYELWRIDPQKGEKQMIMQSLSALVSDPETAVIELPNSVWTLNIAPVGGWKNKNIFYFELIIVLLFSLLCSFLVQNVLTLAIGKNKLLETLKQQANNYKLMNHLNDDLRIFRHDINNHMLSLSNLLKRGEVDSARDYINFISGSLSDSLHIINTENYVFDALVAQKAEEARQKGIHVDQEITINGQLKIDNEDWSILFGNILDNAIEACIQSNERSPLLQIVVKYHSGILHAMITNTSCFDSETDHVKNKSLELNEMQTSKEDKRNHGLGLKQIRLVIKKYHGAMEIVREDQLFTLAFTLFEV